MNTQRLVERQTEAALKTRDAGSSAPAGSHNPVSAEDMLMKFWDDNRITLKERTDYFRWINAENERRANVEVIGGRSTSAGLTGSAIQSKGD